MVKKAKKKVAKKPTKPRLRRFVFSGDPAGSNPDSVSACGYTFKLNGAAVSVNDDAAARLQNNNHFTEK